MDFSDFSKTISKAYLDNEGQLLKLRDKIDILILLLQGITSSLAEYIKYIDKFEIAEQNKQKIVSNKGGKYDQGTINMALMEYDNCLNVENKFEEALTGEAQKYVKLYDESTFEAVKQHKRILSLINKEMAGKADDLFE